jgi:large subunit ribosomal protein LP0
LRSCSQVGAPARVGLVAPIDVVVPPGNTGLDPSQTSFFQVCSKAVSFISVSVSMDFSVYTQLVYLLTF